MSTRSSILAMDGASSVGVCHGPPDADPPTIDTWKLEGASRDLLGEMLLDLRTRMRTLINDSYGFGRVPIKTVIFEKPLLNQRTPNLVMQRKLYSIAGVIEMTAYELQMDIFEVAAGTWKLGFTNDGRCSKRQRPYKPMARCEALGWPVRTFDAADATGLWSYYCVHEFGNLVAPKLLGPLFQNA